MIASLSESFLNVKSLRFTVPLAVAKSLADLILKLSIKEGISHSVWVQLCTGDVV